MSPKTPTNMRLDNELLAAIELGIALLAERDGSTLNRTQFIERAAWLEVKRLQREAGREYSFGTRHAAPPWSD